jgi:four helix bundle protein
MEKAEFKYAESYRELTAYQKSRQLAREIFQKTNAFPREELYSLTSQIRRSSRSIGAQIAEAWAKRRYEKHFVSKLTDADGENQETQHWIETAHDCSYLNDVETSELLKLSADTGRLIAGMIIKSQSFCRQTTEKISESLADYFTDMKSNDR